VVAAYVRPPGDTGEVPLISEPATAGVSELFNASYEVLLQMLMRYFIHGKETEEELQALSSTAVNAMFMVIKPLGQLLTTLPIGPDLPGKMAGQPSRSIAQAMSYLIMMLPGSSCTSDCLKW